MTERGGGQGIEVGDGFANSSHKLGQGLSHKDYYGTGRVCYSDFVGRKIRKIRVFLSIFLHFWRMSSKQRRPCHKYLAIETTAHKAAKMGRDKGLGSESYVVVNS